MKQRQASRTPSDEAVGRIDVRIVAEIGPYELTDIHLDSREYSRCQANQDGGSQNVLLRIYDFLRKRGDAVEADIGQGGD